MHRRELHMEYVKCVRKAGTILAALAVVVMSVGPVAAQEGAFHVLFGEGYGFLQKKVESSVPLAAGNPVSKERPFQTLFADSYAVIRAAGEPLAVTKPAVIAHTETSPFETLFGKGYDKIAPGG
jgi:hypothetical protein